MHVSLRRRLASRLSRWVLPIAIVLLSLVAVAAGPRDACAQISMWEAMELAAANNEAADIARLRVEEAEGRRQTALGEVLPRLSASGSVSRNEQEVSLGSRAFVNLWDYGADLNVSIDLFSPMAIPSLHAATTQTTVERLQETWEQAGLRLAAGRAYVSALAARENLASARQSLEVSRLSLEQTRALAEVGYALAADLSRALLAVIDAEAAVLDSELALADAMDSLAFLLNIPTIAPSELFVPELPREVEGDPSRERTDVQAAALSIETNDVLVRANRLSLLPSLGLTARYDIGPESVRAPDGTSWVVTMSATWLIFDYGRYGRIAEAEARRDQSIAADAALRREVSLEVARAARRLEVSEARADLAERAAEVAAETRELVLEQYRAHDITALEMMEADEALSSAQVSLNLARLEVQLARIELLYLTGTLDVAPNAPGSR